MNDPAGHQAGAALFRRRLEAYVEYAEILKEQEFAAIAGDLDRVGAFNARLDELQAALGGMPAAPAETSDDDHETRALRRRAVEALERASEAQRRLTQKLREARDRTRQEIKNLDGREKQVRSYLDEASPDGRRVNVRF